MISAMVLGHLLIALLAAAPTPHRTKVAVLDLTPVSETDAARAKLLTQVVVAEVQRNGNFDVVSSAEIQGMLGFERQKQLLGCNEDSSCLAELSGALGVDFLVIGQVGKLGNRFRLDLRLIDAARSRVAASEGDFVVGSEDLLGDTTIAMVRRLFEDGRKREGAAGRLAAGGLVSSSAAEGPSRTPAYVALGAAGVLAVGAVLATLKTRSTFDSAKTCYGDPTQPLATCKGNDSSLGWSAPLADALWVAAAASAGTSAYFFLRGPSDGGGGAGLGVGARF